MNPKPETRNPKLEIAIALFLFAVYLLSYRGGFHSVDEVSTFAVTENLVKFGALHTDQIAWTQWTTTPSEAQGFFGADGHVYSKKGLALSLAQSPLYWLALVLPGLGMLQTVSLLNALLTALTGALIAAAARELGFSARTAALTALVFGLATIAWVYAKYLFSGTLAGFLLMLTFVLLLRFSRTRRVWLLAPAGFFGGLTVLARANNLLLLAVFGLYLLAVLKKQEFSRQDAETQSENMHAGWKNIFGFLRLCAFARNKNVIAPVMLFIGGAALAGAIFGWYNWARSGNPLQTGYDLSIFTPNILLGLYKLLFSPLRGLFIYSPVLVLALPGWWQLRKTRPAESWLIGGVVGITVLLFSAWASGEGLSWGSRFMVPIVPMLTLSLAPIIQELRITNYELRKSASSWAVVALMTLSFSIQILGIAINPWVFLGKLQAQFGGEFFLEKTAALYDFSTSQIAGQLRNWSVENSDLIWWQPGQFDGVAFGVSVALVLATGWLLWWLVWGEKRMPAVAIASEAQQFPPTHSETAAARNRRARMLPAGMAILTLAASYFLLARYYRTDTRQFGAPDGGYVTAFNAAAETAPAPVVTVAQYGYHLPMNRFKARVPLLGFAQSVDPLPPTAFPLLENALAAGQGQVWLATVGWQPAQPDNRAEQWLAEHAFKATDDWFADDTRLVRYGTAGDLPRVPLGVSLGNVVQLDAAAFPASISAGDVLPVALDWRAIVAPGEDFSVFVQLLGGDGVPVAQNDSAPQGGYRPTRDWQAGENITDRHGLVVPKTAQPGEYRLVAGMYRPTDGARLVSPDGRDAIELGTIRVTNDERRTTSDES